MIRVVACAVVLSLVGIAAAEIPEGKVAGAIWNYELSPVSGDGETCKGQFRINGNEIYQLRDRKPTVVGKIDGKGGKPKKGDKVKVTFNSLRGDDGGTLSLKGPIIWESFGEVHGRLIDGDGAHWNFSASRVQE